MSTTITGWFLNISFKYYKKVLQGAEWIEADPVVINTRGVVQPPSDEHLKILPAGTWSWEWLMIHCLPNVKLEPNQYIEYDGKKYKVMDNKDYTKYGYVQYTILEAFRAEEVCC